MKMKFKLTLVLPLAFLIGCSSVVQDAAPQQESISNEPPIIAKTNYTKEDAIATFKGDRDESDYEILDCILVEDAQMPRLKAVISYYDKKNEDSCNLAFIHGDLSKRVGFAVNKANGLQRYENGGSKRVNLLRQWYSHDVHPRNGYKRNHRL